MAESAKQDNKPATARESGSLPADPFSAMLTGMERFYDAFSGGSPFFGGAPNMLAPLAGRVLVPNMDVHETDKEVIVSVELPGLKVEDVDLSIDHGHLTIAGEKKLERTWGESDHPRMVERRYGSFRRSLRLPDSIDESKAAAKFGDGVLTVTLPKLSDGQKRRQTIKITAAS